LASGPAVAGRAIPTKTDRTMRRRIAVFMSLSLTRYAVRPVGHLSPPIDSSIMNPAPPASAIEGSGVLTYPVPSRGRKLANPPLPRGAGAANGCRPKVHEAAPLEQGRLKGARDQRGRRRAQPPNDRSIARHWRRCAPTLWLLTSHVPPTPGEP
jgi:hypothetical protein